MNDAEWREYNWKREWGHDGSVKAELSRTANAIEVAKLANTGAINVAAEIRMWGNNRPHITKPLHSAWRGFNREKRECAGIAIWSTLKALVLLRHGGRLT